MNPSQPENKESSREDGKPCPPPTTTYLREGTLGSNVSPEEEARTPAGHRRGQETRGKESGVPVLALDVGRPGLTCSAVLPKRFRTSGCTSSWCRRRRTSCTSPRAAAPLSRSPARTSSSSMSTLAACEAPRPNPERSVRGSPLALARTALPWRDGPARRSRLGSPVRAKARPPPSPADSSLCQPAGREGLSTAQPPAAGRALPGPRPLRAGSPPNSPSLLFDGRGLF